jgi:hypothetical protein
VPCSRIWISIKSIFQFWVGENAANELNIYGMPMIMRVKDGKILEKTVAKRSRKFLEKKIKAILNGS